MSYPTLGWENPIPGRRYAKCGHEAVQDRIARRRERADHHERVWRQMTTYYDKTRNSTAAHDRWLNQRESPLDRRRVCSAPIEQRRQKLKQKLSVEEELYQAEICRNSHRSRPPSTLSDIICTNQGTTSPSPAAAGSCDRLEQLDCIRRQLTERNKRRQMARQSEAQKQLDKQWKLNSAIIREMESERLSSEAREAWKKQIEEREIKRQETKRQEERDQEERERLQEQEEERCRMEEERSAQKIQEIKQELEDQIQQKRELCERLAVLAGEEAELMEKERRLQLAMDQRKQAEEKAKQQHIRLCQVRQFNARLREKSRQIESTLTDEIAFIDKILLSGEADKQLMAETASRAEARQLRSVLSDQLQLESCRRTRAELLFSEEAEGMWQRREREWMREEEARRQLMADVIVSWRQQLDEKLQKQRQQLQILREEEREREQRAAETESRLKEEEQRLAAQKQQQLESVWKEQIDERQLSRQLESQLSAEQLQLQREQDARELASIREQLAKLHCSSRAFQRYERQHCLGRRIVW